MGIVYERLKKLCDMRGISGHKMCVDTGLQPSTMTELKMDRKHSLSAKSLAKVAEYFGVPMAYITGDSDDPFPSPAVPYSMGEGRANYLKHIEEGYTGVAFPTTKGALTITSEDFDELAAIWNTLKDRPEAKMLFKSANSATAEQLLEVAQYLEYLKSKEIKEHYE